MLIRLADQLEIPLRERNVLLNSAGYASLYQEHALDDPAMASVRAAIDQVLRGHEPYPAIAIDQSWKMIAANHAIAALLDGVDPELLSPPVNVLRVALHPNGLAPAVVNYHEWRGHILERLERQHAQSGDPALEDLLAELRAYPTDTSCEPVPSGSESARVFVPLTLRTAHGLLSFISTTTVFGTPLDITLSEIAIEAFLPADNETAKVLHLAARNRVSP
jgi:hypothetical protein